MVDPLRFYASKARWSDGFQLAFRVGKDPVRKHVLKVAPQLYHFDTVKFKPLTRAYLDTLVTDKETWTLRMRAGRLATKEIVIAAPVTFRKVLRAMTTFYSTRLTKADIEVVQRSPPTWNSKSPIRGVHTSDGRELTQPAVLPRMSASDVKKEIKTYGDLIRPPNVYVLGFSRVRGAWQPRFSPR
jgi:hypothetical protein